MTQFPSEYDPTPDYRQSPPPPPTMRGHSLPPNRGGAILALGICSIVFFGGCGLGLILGIIGVKMASTDQQDMAAGRKSRESEGLVSAGRICSIVGICLGSIGALFGLFYLSMLVLGLIAAVANGP